MLDPTNLLLSDVEIFIIQFQVKNHRSNSGKKE